MHNQATVQRIGVVLTGGRAQYSSQQHRTRHTGQERDYFAPDTSEPLKRDVAKDIIAAHGKGDD